MASHGEKHKRELFDKGGMICGLIYGVIGLLVKIFSDSPFNMIHILGADEFLPPLWIFNLLSLFWFFISGICLYKAIQGKCTGRSHSGRQMAVYKGSLFFICMFFLSLIWYPVFFSGKSLFISMIVSLLCFLSSFLCAVSWRQLSTYAFLGLCANGVWLMYIFFVNLIVMLKL